MVVDLVFGKFFFVLFDFLIGFFEFFIEDD